MYGDATQYLARPFLWYRFIENIHFCSFPGPFRGGARVPETAQETTIWGKNHSSFVLAQKKDTTLGVSHARAFHEECYYTENVCASKVFQTFRFELWVQIPEQNVWNSGAILIYITLRVCGAPNARIFGNEDIHKMISPPPSPPTITLATVADKWLNRRVLGKWAQQVFKPLPMPKRNQCCWYVYVCWVVELLYIRRKILVTLWEAHRFYTLSLLHSCL